MANKLVLTDKMLFKADSDENSAFDLTRITTYASNINSYVELRPDPNKHDFINEIRPEPDYSNLITFDTPMKTLTFTNIDFFFGKILLEFPENTDFVGCTLYFQDSYLNKFPRNNKFIDCVVILDSFRRRYLHQKNVLTPEILKITNDFGSYIKNKNIVDKVEK